MARKRDPVRFLPWVFLFSVALMVGVVSAELAWIADFHIKWFYVGSTVFVFILLLSMVAHLWLFCRLSGRPIGDVRRPTLILHGVLILPAPVFFATASIIASRIFFNLGEQINLVWGGVALILIFLEALLLGSRQFSVIFCGRSLERRLGVVVFSGVFVWMLSAVVHGTVFMGL